MMTMIETMMAGTIDMTVELTPLFYMMISLLVVSVLGILFSHTPGVADVASTGLGTLAEAEKEGHEDHHDDGSMPQAA
jgi:hypothetical protein